MSGGSRNIQMSAEQKGTDAQAATQAEATVSSCPCAPAHNHQTQLSALFALSGNDLIARSGVPALCDAGEGSSYPPLLAT